MKSRMILVAGLTAALAAFAAPALAAGDVAAGKKVYNKCKACHSMAEGKNKVGPTLFGIFGRDAATIKGFKYSKAMKASGLKWDEETMTKYLAKPKALVPGTRMTFAGLKKEADIENVIAYMKANGG